MQIPDHLTPEQEKLILGGEATEWAEFITPEILSNRVWPRSAAIAERFWSPQATRDVPSMYARLGWVAHQLSMQGVANGTVKTGMLERIAASTATDRLLVLATMVQPPLDYNREAVETYDETNPLNHLVDAVPSEERDRASLRGACPCHCGRHRLTRAACRGALVADVVGGE